MEIAVNGFDIDGGGVVTYAVTVGETAVKKRFREFVKLSDALKKADPEVVALPNPLHHNLRSTEKLAKTRMDTLKDFLSGLPASAYEGDAWAAFLAVPEAVPEAVDGGDVSPSAGPEKTAAEAEAEAEAEADGDDVVKTPLAGGKQPPARTHSPTFSEADVPSSAVRDLRRFTEAGDAMAEAAAPAAAATAAEEGGAQEEEEEVKDEDAEAPAAAEVSRAEVTAPKVTLEALSKFTGDEDPESAPAPTSAFGLWTIVAIFLSILFAYSQSGLSASALLGKLPSLPPVVPTVEVVDDSHLPPVTATAVGDAVVPSRLKAFYDTYLDAPNKEIKATVLAAATAGVVFRGRHGN